VSGLMLRASLEHMFDSVANSTHAQSPNRLCRRLSHAEG
jgi:hypothetical protein